MALVELSVSTFGGAGVEVEVPADGAVADVVVAVQLKLQVPDDATLILFHGSTFLLPVSPISDLIGSELPLFAAIVNETRLAWAMEAAASHPSYKELFSTATAEVTMPCILDVLTDFGVPSGDLEVICPISNGLLSFSGQGKFLVLPSLDKAMFSPDGAFEPSAGVTFRLGVNSDAYNDGLGFLIEAAPEVVVPEGAKRLPHYVYSSTFAKDESANVIKFHPGMRGGHLRVEGPGGFTNQLMPLLPAKWSDRRELHTLKVTCRADGKNEIVFDDQWTKKWECKLFDGRRLPKISAWIDYVQPDLPLIIGPVHVSFL